MTTDLTRKVCGGHPVYPGHALAVALCIMHAFETPADALAKSEHGWPEALSCSDIPGAGDGAYAGVGFIRRLLDGQHIDTVVEWSREEWRRRVGPQTSNCVGAFGPGQEQADALEPKVRARAEAWLRGDFRPPMVFSIRAEYVREILAGRKRWEFRTRKPSIGDGEFALIYESRGCGRVVASFRRGRAISGSPKAVWDSATRSGGGHGISWGAYGSYFIGRERAHAVELLDVKPLDMLLPLGMRAPQAWARWKGEWPGRPEWR